MYQTIKKPEQFLYVFLAMATYIAIARTYSYLTPDMWPETQFNKTPYQEFTDYLAKNHAPGGRPQPVTAS